MGLLTAARSRKPVTIADGRLWDVLKPSSECLSAVESACEVLGLRVKLLETEKGSEVHVLPSSAASPYSLSPIKVRERIDSAIPKKEREGDADMRRAGRTIGAIVYAKLAEEIFTPDEGVGFQKRTRIATDEFLGILSDEFRSYSERPDVSRAAKEAASVYLSRAVNPGDKEGPLTAGRVARTKAQEGFADNVLKLLSEQGLIEQDEYIKGEIVPTGRWKALYLSFIADTSNYALVEDLVTMKKEEVRDA